MAGETSIAGSDNGDIDLKSKITSLNAEIEELKADRLRHAIGHRQCQDALKRAGVAPVPPVHLQIRVVGGYAAEFVSSADGALNSFANGLRKVGKTLADFDNVLDFGVGCGRVARRFAELYPGSRLVGADIDPEAINWLQRYYSPRLGDFRVLPHSPPSTNLADAEFDLVYSISVFTHLNEDMQLDASNNRVF